MSIEKSYVRNLTLKYKLAVAIAVIKEKPENTTIEQYIEELKTNLNDNDIDLDVTICSDDFHVDDTVNDIPFNDNDIPLNDISRPNNDATIDITENDRISNDTSSDRTTNEHGYVNKADVNGTSNNYNDTATDKQINDSDRVFNDTVVIQNENGECNDNIRPDTNYGEKEKTNIKNTSCSQNSATILKDYHDNIIREIGNNRENIEFVNINAVNVAEEQHNAAQIDTSQSILAQNYMSNSNFCEPQYLQKDNAPKLIVHQKEFYEDLLFLNNFCEKSKNVPDTYCDSQATVLYTVPRYSQNYTHVSQSQNECDQIVLNEKYLTNNNRLNTNDIEIGLGVTSYDSRKNNTNYTTNLSIEDINIIPDNHIGNNYNESNIAPINRQDSMQIQSFSQHAQDYDKQTYDHSTQHEVNDNIENEIAFEHTEQINEHEVESPITTEIVSFKVIEELNKVKKYINRINRKVSNDGSDSGYSDSLKSSFRSSFQTPSNWVNQSAYSLFEYITQSPLLASTQEIIKEIAQVLGQLIDKLHEEEKYPTFLEEILGRVEVLLQDVMRGLDKDALLNKEEIIQRLLLLNKSKHIQRYTIEKISTLLEFLHSDLTKSETTYELTNTDQMENLPYLFHILEVLLKNYTKEKVISSQESSDSQIELKRSTLSDVWRRKWNPKYEENISKVEENPKKCVITKCNDVLNKLVVDCMAGYSLVAFSALQCFNMLQS